VSTEAPVPRSGFALVLALVVLVVASTALAMRVRVAVQHFHEAEGYLRQVIDQVGVSSVQKTLLQHSEVVLQSQHLESDRAVSRWIEFKLNGSHWRARVSDEQAKLSILNCERELSMSQVVRLVSQASGQTSPNTLGIRTLLQSRSAIETPYGYEMLWDQVTAAQLFGSPEAPEDAGLFTAATLWSDGRLNIARASEDTLIAMADDILSHGQIQELIEQIRSADPEDMSLSMLLGNDLTDQEREKLSERLTTDSEAYAVVLMKITQSQRVISTVMQAEYRDLVQQVSDSPGASGLDQELEELEERVVRRTLEWRE